MSVFSRTEREFLRLLAGDVRGEGRALLQSRFPNPVYRRQLLWGIRRKALAAAEDWELYARAAARESRVVHPQVVDLSAEVPAYTEPFAALVNWLAGHSHRSKARKDREARRGGA
jgi:hypothetical protein